jgi:trans-2,3-dihydro-3-hydroxyanthranilate isomerase
MRLEFETCDVFTDTRFGGNPLAVVFDAVQCVGVAMQRIAREFNLSETVFVLRPDAAGADARIRIFTPGLEMPFAGHPNVGTAVLLARRRGGTGDSVVLDQPAGRVVATLARAGDTVIGADIVAPMPFTTGADITAAAAAACVGLPADAIVIASHSPRVGGCGVAKLLVEVTDLAALAAAAPDLAAFRAHIPPLNVTGIHLYTRLQPDRVRARMFGPLAGVMEDPATGSANVALGGLLLVLAGTEMLAFDVEQGIEMGRPSLLHVAAWRDAEGAIRVRVGGGVVAVSTGAMEIG